MEEKLAAYRRRKRQKEALISFKNKVIAMIPFAGGKPKDDKDSCVVEPVVHSQPRFWVDIQIIISIV